jgi:outer membrane lipase/esterase
MKTIRVLGLSLITAALLAACGGGDEPYVAGTTPTAGAPTTKGSFTSVVAFGDSLTDNGAYAPATSLTGNGQAPYFGGKFTTNGASGTVWVENLATRLGLAITPAEVGFGGTSVKCPAAAITTSLAGTCTGYAQGGSRVTDPNGIGKAGGALTVPVVKQIENHLARFGSFKDSDLILVFVGANDVFTQFGAFTAKATQIQTAAATGQIAQDEAQRQLFAAQTAAQTEMKKAATELSGYVKSQILAKGGKYIAVMNLPDIADTPFGKSLPASVQPVLTDLSLIFNLWLREGLANQPVQMVDTLSMFKDLYQNPSKYGIANVTVPACDAVKISAITSGRVADGSSLFCNATPGAPYNGLRTGADINTWAFADGVHPTTAGHRIFADVAYEQLKAYGWL